MARFTMPFIYSAQPYGFYPYFPCFPKFEANENEICNVWHFNLEQEFKNIQRVILRYKCVAIDTEFPGVVIKPQNGYKAYPELAYLALKCNADNLKLIQLGMAFFDEKGNSSKTEFGYSTWQFNFHYDLNADLHAEESIQFLKKSGMQFEKHRYAGIRHVEFAELLMSSGVVLMDNVKFIAFHACYDFAYLMKILTNNALPKTEKKFVKLLKLYFQTVYDVDHVAKKTQGIYGGLQLLADQLKIERVGRSHQAGSDALLTGNVFFKIRSLFYNDHFDEKEFSGVIAGLSLSFGEV